MPLDNPQTWTLADLTAHGGVYYSDPSKVPSPDEVPDQFTFTDQSDVGLSSTVTSAPVTISGLADGVEIEFTADDGGTIDKNNDGNFQATQDLGNGDTMRARVTSSAINSDPVSVTVTGGGISDTFTATTEAQEGEPGDWQLAAGHFVPAKMAPLMTAPRPDAEREDWSVYSLWPSQTPYRVPVAIQGSAWPGKYTLVDADGLTGLTMTEVIDAEHFNETGELLNYGVLTCASPAIGEYDITVGYTDQDLTYVERTFKLFVRDREDTDYFVWVDIANGSNSNDGSFSNPKQTDAGWYGVDKLDATNRGKQVHFRAGTYPITDAVIGGSTSQQRQHTSNKPMVFCAYDDEEVIFDGEDEAYYEFESSCLGDIAFIGIRFQNPNVIEGGTDPGTGNPRTRKQFIKLSGTDPESRFLAFRNFFDGGGLYPVVTNSNASCVMYAGTGTNGRYGVVSQNTFHNCDNMDFVLYYTSQYTLTEGNHVTGTYGQGASSHMWGFFFKGLECDSNTVRANTGLDMNRTMVHFSVTTANVKGNLEVCWNRGKNMYSTDGTRDAGTVVYGQSTSIDPSYYGPYWEYRNSWKVDHFERWELGTGPFVIEKNVVECDSGHVANKGYIAYTAENEVVDLTGLTAVGATGTMFDANLQLTGDARTAYLGVHGCEIA